MTKINILPIAALLFSLSLAAQPRQLSLGDCLELSRKENSSVKNAELDISSARAQKAEAFTKYFPSISAHAYGFMAMNPLVNLGLDDFLGGSDASNMLKYYLETASGITGIPDSWSCLKNGYVLGVTAIQPVFAGGRIVNGNALASLGVRAAELKKDMASRDAEDAVTGKYWTVVSLMEKEKALGEAIALVTSLEKDVESARGAGLAASNDLLKVQLKKKELESAGRKLAAGIKLAKMDLFNTIGLTYEVMKLDGITLSDSLEGLKSPEEYRRDEAEVASRLDESRLLSLNLEAKELEKKMALGETLPQVGLGAAYGYSKIVGEPRTNGAVFATVKIPLTDWIGTSKKLVRCSNEIEKARSEKEYLDRQLALKVRKEWVDLECAWDQVEVSAESVALSENNEKQVRAAYEAGTATLAEVLQAQTELSSARSALADSRIAYCNAVCVWQK